MTNLLPGQETESFYDGIMLEELESENQESMEDWSETMVYGVDQDDDPDYVLKQRRTFLHAGAKFTKYNYGDLSGTIRELKLTEDNQYIQWTKPGLFGPYSSSSSVHVSEMVAILFGARSQTFQLVIAKDRNFLKRVPEWCCFSIVTGTRTIDFSGNNEDLVLTTILGIQDAMTTPYMKLLRGEILGKRGWMKVNCAGRKLNMSAKEYLCQKIVSYQKAVNNENQRLNRSLFSRSKAVLKARRRAQRRANSRLNHSRVFDRSDLNSIHSSSSIQDTETDLAHLLKRVKHKLKKSMSVSHEDASTIQKLSAVLSQKVVQEPTLERKCSNSSSDAPSYGELLETLNRSPSLILDTELSEMDNFQRYVQTMDREKRDLKLATITLQGHIESILKLLKEQKHDALPHVVEELLEEKSGTDVDTLNQVVVDLVKELYSGDLELPHETPRARRGGRFLALEQQLSSDSDMESLSPSPVGRKPQKSAMLFGQTRSSSLPLQLPLQSIDESDVEEPKEEKKTNEEEENVLEAAVLHTADEVYQRDLNPIDAQTQATMVNIEAVPVLSRTFNADDSDDSVTSPATPKVKEIVARFSQPTSSTSKSRRISKFDA